MSAPKVKVRSQIMMFGDSNMSAHTEFVALPRASKVDKGQLGFVVAWGFCLLFYFGQYALRSAPGVMVPELTDAFGLTTLGVSSLLGLYYYTYSTFAIVAGASLDRLGAKYVIPAGIVVTATGSVLFGIGRGFRSCISSTGFARRMS
jgi:fucose permease